MDKIWLSCDSGGEVWAGDSSGRIRSTGTVCQHPYDDRNLELFQGHVHVPGFRHNAALITGLLACMRPYHRLSVCGPKYVSSDIKKDVRRTVGMHCVFDGLSVPSASGVRPAFLADFPSYFLFYFQARLGRHVVGSPYRSVESDRVQASSLLTRHPAYVWLSALNLPMRELEILEILGFIGEPRWYRLSKRPDRLKLDAAFKLDAASCQQYLQLKRESLPLPVLALLNLVATGIKADSAACAWLRESFYSKQDQALGLLAAARRFLRYLDMGWVALTDRSMPPEHIFVPDSLFAGSASLPYFVDVIKYIADARKKTS